MGLMQRVNMDDFVADVPCQRGCDGLAQTWRTAPKTKGRLLAEPPLCLPPGNGLAAPEFV